MMSDLNTAHDERLDAGMRLQQELLRRAETDGATQLGWKAGFGTREWRSILALDAPLVGFLLDRTLLRSDAPVGVGDWVAPRAEAEIAVRLGQDVPGDASTAEALAAVEALAPAIELVDVTTPPEDLRTILAGNIYHRYWKTGTYVAMDATRDLTGIIGRVEVEGAALEPVTDVQASTGGAGAILAEVARMAERHGRGLRSGDVVILGSIVPPVPVAAGGSLRFALDDGSPLEILLSR